MLYHRSILLWYTRSIGCNDHNKLSRTWPRVLAFLCNSGRCTLPHTAFSSTISSLLAQSAGELNGETRGVLSRVPPTRDSHSTRGNAPSRREQNNILNESEQRRKTVINLTITSTPDVSLFWRMFFRPLSFLSSACYLLVYSCCNLQHCRNNFVYRVIHDRIVCARLSCKTPVLRQTIFNVVFSIWKDRYLLQDKLVWYCFTPDVWMYYHMTLARYFPCQKKYRWACWSVNSGEDHYRDTSRIYVRYKTLRSFRRCAVLIFW